MSDLDTLEYLFESWGFDLNEFRVQEIIKAIKANLMSDEQWYDKFEKELYENTVVAKYKPTLYAEEDILKAAKRTSRLEKS